MKKEDELKTELNILKGFKSVISKEDYEKNIKNLCVDFGVEITHKIKFMCPACGDLRLSEKEASECCVCSGNRYIKKTIEEYK